MPKEICVEKINKRIKLDEDCVNASEAMSVASQFLISEGYKPRETEGMIYVDGPGVADLLIIAPTGKRSRNMGLRNCTNVEWNMYFWTWQHERAWKGTIPQTDLILAEERRKVINKQVIEKREEKKRKHEALKKKKKAASKKVGKSAN